MNEANPMFLLHMTLVGLNCWPCRNCPNLRISILASYMAEVSLDTSFTIDVSENVGVRCVCVCVHVCMCVCARVMRPGIGRNQSCTLGDFIHNIVFTAVRS